MVYSRDLNLMMNGDETAQNLGVEIERTKKILLVVSSLMIAFIVSSSGIIGFVGLIVPHAIRLLLGADHRVLIPFSALGGAIFMILSDTLARTLLAPMEIPVGAITALFGAPYFIFLLNKTKRKGL
jgi:iron complex transport system permease protein